MKKIFSTLLLFTFIYGSSDINAQNAERTTFNAGINMTALWQDQFTGSESIENGEETELYNGVSNNVGVFLGAEKSKPIASNLHVCVGANLALQRYKIDSIYRSNVQFDREFYSTVSSMQNTTINLNINIFLAYDIPKTPIILKTGLGSAIGIRSYGLREKTTTTYYEQSLTAPSEIIVKLDPERVRYTKDRSPMTNQIAILLGVSTYINDDLSINLNYYHGISQTFYKFNMNSFEIFIGKKFGS